MKRSNIMSVMCIMCLLAAACFAQAPTLIPDQKLGIREAQHKLDTIEKQQKDLGLQIQDIQTKITNESQRLQKAQQEAKAALDKVTTDSKAGVDDKKWQLDAETLTFTAVPAPAAPPNASTTQPAKPASSGSPGAAVPQIQQQAKK